MRIPQPRSFRKTLPIVAIAIIAMPSACHADEPVTDVDLQPVAALAGRIVQAMESLGDPLSESERNQLVRASNDANQAKALAEIQRVLDQHCLVQVSINPESRVKVKPLSAKKELIQHGWRNFLVKVINEGGVTSKLRVTSPNALPMVKGSTGSPSPKPHTDQAGIAQRFLDVSMYDNQPMTEKLSGLKLDYRIIQLYSRDAGPREALLQFDVGQGTQDLGFRAETPILFQAAPSTELTFEVFDEAGKPTTGSFIFRDQLGRVYPAQSRRLAPDFFFHAQVYRSNGETIRLPAGTYAVEYTRGPEYRIETRKITIPNQEKHRERFDLKRWIDLKKFGYYSGDHHVHAAGCAHYESPTEGVKPADMMRHILGEDLNVGCVLSWGPCWYHQKQYFEGKTSNLSQPNYLMRYDVEVSGFPSSQCGHLCLLNLKEDDYPGTQRIEDWPSWNNPIFEWAKKQGGVVGYSHSAFGLHVPTFDLPSYDVPPFDGIGANEFIVNAALRTCDFISTVDTCAPNELNIWYHTLNAGCTARISGETDFPCIYGQRVGIGRVYVKMNEPLAFEPWVMGLKQGRSYVSDGLSHLIDFKVNNFDVGTGDGTLAIEKPGKVQVTAKVAALLGEKPDDVIRRTPLFQPPYWHVERARVGETRKVPVEVIVNGYPVARQEVIADGSVQDVAFDIELTKSSWVALRIYPSSHTNPVFVTIAGKPIRASKKSIEWCIKAVEQCFKAKSPNMRRSEIPAARKAYDQAKEYYQKVLAEAAD